MTHKFIFGTFTLLFSLFAITSCAEDDQMDVNNPSALPRVQQNIADPLVIDSTAVTNESINLQDASEKEKEKEKTCYGWECVQFN